MNPLRNRPDCRRIVKLNLSGECGRRPEFPSAACRDFRQELVSAASRAAGASLNAVRGGVKPCKGRFS